MKIDLKKFADSLTDESIIDIMSHLGANNYKETNSAIIFLLSVIIMMLMMQA